MQNDHDAAALNNVNLASNIIVDVVKLVDQLNSANHNIRHTTARHYLRAALDHLHAAVNNLNVYATKLNIHDSGDDDDGATGDDDFDNYPTHTAT